MESRVANPVVDDRPMMDTATGLPQSESGQSADLMSAIEGVDHHGTQHVYDHGGSLSHKAKLVFAVMIF
jgi:hypothetical protein